MNSTTVIKRLILDKSTQQQPIIINLKLRADLIPAFSRSKSSVSFHFNNFAENRKEFLTRSTKRGSIFRRKDREFRKDRKSP